MGFVAHEAAERFDGPFTGGPMTVRRSVRPSVIGRAHATFASRRCPR